MKLKITFSCLLFVTIFLSCKKEDLSNCLNSGKNPNGSLPLLSKVLIDNQSAGQGSDKVQITQDSYTYNSMSYPVTKNGNTTFIYN